MTFSVELPLDAPEVVHSHKTSLATLPGSFFIVDGGRPDVVVLPGDSSEWLDRAKRAVEDGGKFVVIHRPGPEDLSRVGEFHNLANSAGVRVAIHSPYVAHRAWRELLTIVREYPESLALVDSTVTVTGRDIAERALQIALLDQLALVRPILSASTSLKRATAVSNHHYVVTGGATSPAISLCGIATDGKRTESLQINLVSEQRRWNLVFYNPDSARPAEVTQMDGEGEHATRPFFESGCRALWRSILQALETESSVIYGLDDYIANVEITHALN